MSQQSARIVQDVHDEPHIEGSRITVRHVYERVRGRGLRPETVAERYTLDIADVYHALAYYYEHPEEMREIERRRDDAIKSARQKTTITPPDE
jgi:uncharacterized protein (DUF433 family)